MSPNIDALASRGVRLANHYSHPTCTPTRAALMTGLYSANTGLTIAAMPGSVSGLPTHLPTAPQLLRQRNYEAHMVGKWHLGHAQWAQTPVGRGFQSFTGPLMCQFDSWSKIMYRPDGLPISVDWISAREDRSFVHDMQPETHATTAVTAEAVAVIERHGQFFGASAAAAAQAPLFLYVAFTAAHAPLQPLPEHLAACSHQQHPWRRDFCGMVVGADEGVGNITAAAERVLGANTLVVVTSDNGAAPWFGGSNGPLRGGKTSPFEGGVRVPALVVDMSGLPGEGVGRYLGRGDRWFRGLAHMSDWLPTMLGWAGGSEAAPSYLGRFDGFDLGPALRAGGVEGGQGGECGLAGNGSSGGSQGCADELGPRREVLLDLYCVGESVWDREEVAAMRVGRYKLVQGTARDPHWYGSRALGTPGTAGTAGEGREGALGGWAGRLLAQLAPVRLSTTDAGWAAAAGEALVRAVEPLVGAAQFDTLRAVVVWGHVLGPTRNGTLLFDLEEDPLEMTDLAAERPALVADLAARIDAIRRARPPQSTYWMVVDNFRATLEPGSCGGAVAEADCLFAHPWLADDANLSAIPLRHTVEVARWLIRGMAVRTARAALLYTAAAAVPILLLRKYLRQA